MSDFTKSRISGSDSFTTPKDLYDSLNAEFHFNDDPCPLEDKPIIDGLARSWGTCTFLNPPYSNPTPWCKKAVEEMNQGKVVVGLLRGDTSTRWFHNWVLPYAEIRFVKGRIRFGNYTLRVGEYAILPIWLMPVSLLLFLLWWWQ